jgi:general secretion pathway protein F
MRTYAYKGFDASGRVAKGLVEAVTLKEARERLAADGILAERLQASGRAAPFRTDARAVVYRELGALLEAGLPLVRALDILIASPELPGSRHVLAGVRDRVREGAALAAAWTEASPSVTAFEQAVLEAAERSATLGEMLERLADFLEEQDRLRLRVQNALLYPAIVLGAGICVAVIMLGLLLPRAQAVLTSGGAALPWLTRALMASGRAMVRWGWAPLALAAGGLAAWRVRLRRDPARRAHWDRLVLRLPVAGRGLTLLANLRFARTLAVLVRGGVPLVDALALAGRATGNTWLAGLAVREAEAVRNGSSLSDAVRRIPTLASTLPGWIRIGEAGGGLDRLLDSAAQRYQARWDRFIGQSLALLEPLLILVIGGFVLLITLSILLPVFSLTQSVAG